MKDMDKHIAFFNEKKKNGDFSRLGKLFSTEKQRYMYDLGTGKVVQCTEEEFLILENIFGNNGLEHYETIPLDDELLEKVLLELEHSINHEKLLMAPKLQKFVGGHSDLKFALEHKLVQVTLELTKQCNLECNYCINGEAFHQTNRDGLAKDMSVETAKAAIDYLFLHSGDEVAVTFYGGEPLLKYDLLKELVEYSKRKNELEKKELTFSMTTNLTLMTKEIAEYLASIEDFAVVCSVDGPKRIHDEHRVMHDRSGSFEKTIAGLEMLIKAYGEKASTYITINSVITPPYTMEKFDEMQAFYCELSWLPKDLSIQTTYVEMAENSELEHIFKEAHGEFGSQEIFSPLHDWIDRQDDEKDSIFCRDFEMETYLYIHKRAILEKPVDGYSLSGCCVPGAQRLYVTVDGDYIICERVKNAPVLGNVHTGVDLQLVQKHYLEDYLHDALKDCGECWAARLCKSCFIDCFNKDKQYDSRLKKENCQRERALQEM